MALVSANTLKRNSEKSNRGIKTFEKTLKILEKKRAKL